MCSTAAGGESCPSSGSSSCCPRRSSCCAAPARRSRTRTASASTPSSSSSRSPRRRREFELQARNPANTAHIGGNHMVFAPVYGCPFIREGDVRRDAKMADFENLVRSRRRSPNSTPRRHDLRARGPAAGLAPPRHGLRAADAVGQAVHGLGHERAERRRHDPHGRDPVRRARGDRARAGVDLPDQRQLAAALRRPHARRDVRVREGQPGGCDHPVPADGRDVAGVAAGDARAADGRGAGRDRAGAADPAGRAGGLRLVSVQHRHAVGLAVVRHAGVGHRRALHRADRAPLRPAVARRRRAQRVADGRRPGRLRVADDDSCRRSSRAPTS